MNALKKSFRYDNMSCQTPKTITKKPLFLRNNNLFDINCKSGRNTYKNLNFIFFKKNKIRKNNKSENLNIKIDDYYKDILITNTSNNSIKYRSLLQTAKDHSKISLSTKGNKINYSNIKLKKFISNNVNIKDIILFKNKKKNKITLKNTQQFAFISNKQKNFLINKYKSSKDSRLKIYKTMSNFHRPKTCKIKKFDEKFTKFLEIAKKI